ncbi:MAG TPA: DOMON-like domain-containing protein [Steroidobacteraceae bacterium]|nr:DOMON-like domain-containing protein [Steroidobacteraceae bacterium]
MSHADPQRLQLLPHPSTMSEVVRALRAIVSFADGGRLALQYQVDADMSRVVLPSPGGGERADGLWKHTCFEAFIKRASPVLDPYLELNFSSAPQWAAYAFDGYRCGMSPVSLASAPQISARVSSQQLVLDASLQLPESLRPASKLLLALTAVIEEDTGSLSYWAARHAPGQPDFHHPDGFVLELPT